MASHIKKILDEWMLSQDDLIQTSDLFLAPTRLEGVIQDPILFYERLSADDKKKKITDDMLTADQNLLFDDTTLLHLQNTLTPFIVQREDQEEEIVGFKQEQHITNHIPSLISTAFLAKFDSLDMSFLDEYLSAHKHKIVYESTAQHSTKLKRAYLKQEYVHEIASDITLAKVAVQQEFRHYVRHPLCCNSLEGRAQITHEGKPLGFSEWINEHTFAQQSVLVNENIVPFDFSDEKRDYNFVVRVNDWADLVRLDDVPIGIAYRVEVRTPFPRLSNIAPLVLDPYFSHSWLEAQILHNDWIKQEPVSRNRYLYIALDRPFLEKHGFLQAYPDLLPEGRSYIK